MTSVSCGYMTFRVGQRYGRYRPLVIYLRVATFCHSREVVAIQGWSRPNEAFSRDSDECAYCDRRDRRNSEPYPPGVVRHIRGVAVIHREAAEVIDVFCGPEAFLPNPVGEAQPLGILD